MLLPPNIATHYIVVQHFSPFFVIIITSAKEMLPAKELLHELWDKPIKQWPGNEMLFSAAVRSLVIHMPLELDVSPKSVKCSGASFILLLILLAVIAHLKPIDTYRMMEIKVQKLK